MIDEKIVRHVAKLARLDLSDEEVKKFSSQLEGIFEYMEILNDIDVEGVELTSQVTGLLNVLGKDEIIESPCSRDELLECSELSVDSKQVRVMQIIK